MLEIGTGCGFAPRLLSHVASEVYSIERLRGLHERARSNLRPFRLATCLMLPTVASAMRAAGPYAGIIAAAGGEEVPAEWVSNWR